MRNVLVGVLAVVLAGLTSGATAELYRWRDPQSGTIKYSSYPPPWFGNEAREGNAPKVEVLNGPQPEGKGSSKPADEMAEKVAEVIHYMEQRRQQLIERMTIARASAGFDPSNASFQADLRAYRAVTGELDKFDPKGATARRRADARVFENLGIEGRATGEGPSPGAEPQPAQTESAPLPPVPPPPASASRDAPVRAQPLGGREPRQ